MNLFPLLVIDCMYLGIMKTIWINLQILKEVILDYFWYIWCISNIFFFYPIMIHYAKEYSLDKQQTSYDDLLDALCLSLKGYNIR